MNNLLKFAVLSMLATTTLLAQTDRPATDTNRATDTRSDNRDEGREHHNYGWIGLLGLAGLAGLRRKSEIHERLESQGVNVKIVRT
jgi:MYXO-CTERM domain-containing protein